MSHRARLLISCPDRPGIVAAVSQFLFEHGANLAHSDQHTTDPQGGVFFLRMEFDLPGVDGALPELEREFGMLAGRFDMEWRLALARPRKRLAVFVSREEHCLLELLWQSRSGDVPADVALVVSNHETLRPVAEAWGIPYHHVPITSAGKRQAEARQQALVEHAADVIVLARYMQILSPEFVGQWPSRIINIHHSFLPAFAGANPYVQAHQRGVKL